MTVSFDSNVLLNWYQAQANVAAASTNGGVRSTATSASAAAVPTAPWNRRGAIPPDNALVTNALSGRPFVDEKAAKVDVATANGDYKKLFAINQGLATLQALASAANDPKTPAFKLASLQQAFDRGMSEISTYVEAAKFDNFRLTAGVATGSETSSAGVATAQDSYLTPPLVSGSSDTVVPAFQGAVQFSMDVTRAASGANPAHTATVTFDLSEMGATPRTMSAVTAYMNTKLQAANVGIRVAVNKTDVPEHDITVNGVKTILTPASSQVGFKLTGLSLETVTFSAPTTAPAVYVAQIAGDPDPDGNPTTNDAHQQQELLKLETGSGADAARRPGDTNFVAGRVFAQKLPDGVGAVHATVTGADGSVYMVADATGTVAGQPIKGAQDAVLLKYDSAGALTYARTLGAGSTASGATIALSADGKVAIAGQIAGELDAGDSGADPKTADSFVTVFDTKGQELWSDRQGALGADQAQAVTFDAVDNVYVAGKTQGTIGGGTSAGGADGYLRAYSAAGKVQSTKQFGSVADDSVSGLVVNGSQVLVAGLDGGAAVVRSFDVTDPKQMTLTASRNFGSVGGGSIGGIGLDGSGNLLIGGATSSDLGVATTTLARGGGMDGFGLRISTDLTSTASDAVAYYGGSGTDRATAATVAGGRVWLTGTSKTDLPGMATPVGKQDGFVAALDVGAGAVTYSQRFTAQDRIDAPEAIAVDAAGGSPLDVMGFPRGTIQYGGSALVTAATSARAGDQFQVRMGTSKTSTTITIAADDTLASLQAKIQRAGLFEINVSTLSNGKTTQLTLKPATDRQTFELLPGPSGRDALTSLGLKAGLIRNTIVDKAKGGVVPADKGTQTYGMRFTAKLDLANRADIKSAIDGVTNAMTSVRAIYSDLKQAATPKSLQQQQQSGNVPAYLQSQIADYTAALDRLTAGNSTDGSSGSSLVSLFG